MEARTEQPGPGRHDCEGNSFPFVAGVVKAFRGELVPTEAELAHQEGRDYEPASVLSERIRVAHTAGETSGTKRTSRRRKMKGER